MKEAGLQILRFPGGSLSDEYHWLSNKSLTNTWTWSTSFSKFVNVATNVGAQAFITVNYGSGTAAEAAAWVKHANVTNRYAFKYWEIGNECYGTSGDRHKSRSARCLYLCDPGPRLYPTNESRRSDNKSGSGGGSR